MMNIKRTVTLLLCALMALSLAACGGKAEDDPNAGLYTATTAEMYGIEMPVVDVFEEGFSIEIKGGGKCTLMADGEKASGKWTLEDGAFHVKGGGLECDGTLANGVMTLTDVLGTGATLKLVREGSASGDIPALNLPGLESGEAAPADDGKAATDHKLNGVYNGGLEYWDENDNKQLVPFKARIKVYADDTWSMEFRYPDGMQPVFDLTDLVVEGDYLNYKGTAFGKPFSGFLGGYDTYGVEPQILKIFDDSGNADLDFDTLLVREDGAWPTDKDADLKPDHFLTMDFDSPAPSASSAAAPVETADTKAFWDGTWYGWFSIPTSSGEYADVEGQFSTAWAQFVMDDAENGAFNIYIDTNEQSFASAKIKATDDGFTVTEGWLYSGSYALDWTPKLSDGDKWYASGTYSENADDKFDYEFCFRKYGSEWSKEDDIILPPSYEGYINTITEEGYLSGGGTTAPAAPAATQAPAAPAGGFDRTKPMGEGYATPEIRDALSAYFKANYAEYRTLTLADLETIFGGPAQEIDESRPMRSYTWHTKDGQGRFIVTLMDNDGDSVFTINSTSPGGSLLN